MMQKKILVAGVINLQGRAKASGNPYSMFKLTALEPAVIERNVHNASGYVAREFDCNEQVMRQLERERFPVEVDAFLQIGRDNKVEIDSVRILEQRETVKPAAVGKPAA